MGSQGFRIRGPGSWEKLSLKVGAARLKPTRIAFCHRPRPPSFPPHSPTRKQTRKTQDNSPYGGCKRSNCRCEQTPISRTHNLQLPFEPLTGLDVLKAFAFVCEWGRDQTGLEHGSPPPSTPLLGSASPPSCSLISRTSRPSRQRRAMIRIEKEHECLFFQVPLGSC